MKCFLVPSFCNENLRRATCARVIITGNSSFYTVVDSRPFKRPHLYLYSIPLQEEQVDLPTHTHTHTFYEHSYVATVSFEPRGTWFQTHFVSWPTLPDCHEEVALGRCLPIFGNWWREAQPTCSSLHTENKPPLDPLDTRRPPHRTCRNSCLSFHQPFLQNAPARRPAADPIKCYSIFSTVLSSPNNPGTGINFIIQVPDTKS